MFQLAFNYTGRGKCTHTHTTLYPIIPYMVRCISCYGSDANISISCVRYNITCMYCMYHVLSEHVILLSLHHLASVFWCTKRHITRMENRTLNLRAFRKCGYLCKKLRQTTELLCWFNDCLTLGHMTSSVFL